MDTSWRALSLINSGIRDWDEQLTVYNMFFKLTEVLCLSRLPRWQTTCLACLIQSPFECAQKRRTTSYPLPDISFLVYRNLSVWLFCLFLVLLTQKPCSFKSYRDGFIYSYIFIFAIRKMTDTTYFGKRSWIQTNYSEMLQFQKDTLKF